MTEKKTSVDDIIGIVKTEEATNSVEEVRKLRGRETMTEKRFHWDWKTGRMKDTYSNSQATKDMRLIERQVNDACQSYEKQIAKLKNENEQLKHKLQQQELEYATTCNRLAEENEQLKQYKDAVLNCDSSKIIRVNRNTGEVDLIDKEYSDES